MNDPVVTYPETRDRHLSVSLLALFALVAFYITLPLFLGQSLPDSHDIIFHIFQSDQFDRSLREGLWYPRWIADTNNGYGSPNFVFYAPLSYAITSALRHLSLPLIPAVTTAAWLAFFLSGVTMFIAASRIFGKAAGLPAAIFYEIVPFHLLVLYERGGYAELFAFVWFPLIALFLSVLSEHPRKTAFIGLGLSYAGLILTHLVSAYMFTIVICLFLAHRFLRSGANWKRLPGVVISLLLGIGLSAIYLMPAAFEEKYVNIDYIRTCIIGDYRKNFLSITDIPSLHGFQLEMRIFAIVDLLLFLLIMSFAWRGPEKTKSRDRSFFALLFVGALLLTMPLSRAAWAVIPKLPMIQFPWRWLSILEVSLCFMVGSVFSADGARAQPSVNLKNATIIGFFVFFAAVSLYFVVTSALLPDSLLRRVISVREYTPLWVTDRDRIMSEHPVKKVSTVAGTAACGVIYWKSGERKIGVYASTPAVLRLSTFYFPGWEASVDHRPIPIGIEKGTGAMLVDVPAGGHEVLLRFTDTPLRRDAAIISIISLLMLAVIGTLYDNHEVRRRLRNSWVRGKSDE